MKTKSLVMWIAIIVLTATVSISSTAYYFGLTTTIALETGRGELILGIAFVVQITKHSFMRMELNIGSQIYLTFKASAVRII